MKNSILILAIIAMIAMPLNASANNAPTTAYDTMLYDITNPYTGEVITLTVEFKATVQSFTDYNDKYHYKFLFSGKGYGVDSDGVTYHASLHSKELTMLSENSAQHIYTTLKSRVTAQGYGIVEKITISAHIVMNANGDIVVNIERP